MAVAIAIRGRLSRTSTVSYHDRNDERREDSASSIRRQTFLVKSAGSGTSGCQLRSNFDRSSFMFLSPCSVSGSESPVFCLRSPLRISAPDHLQAREVGAWASHSLHAFANASLIAIAGDYLGKTGILGIVDEYQLCFRHSHRAPSAKPEQRRKRVTAGWTGDGYSCHHCTNCRDSKEFE